MPVWMLPDVPCVICFGYRLEMCIRDSFKGGLDFLLVVDHLLLLTDLRQIGVGLIAPGVENRYVDFGDEVPHRAAGVKQAGELAAATGKRAGQGDRRKEGRPRGADVGVGRPQAVFGL